MSRAFDWLRGWWHKPKSAVLAASGRLIERRGIRLEQYRADVLAAERDDIQARLAQSEQAVAERDSVLAILRAEIEFLALWRERELERLRTETAILVSRRAKAIGGGSEDDDG